MSWHNGRIQRNLEAVQARLTEEYRSAGMTEGQIGEILAFDREALRSDRRFYRHVQFLSPCGEAEDNPEPAEDGREPQFRDRMGWLEEIEDPILLDCLREASPKLREILTLYVFEGYNQTEIARLLCCSRQNVTEMLRNFRGKVRRRREAAGS